LLRCLTRHHGLTEIWAEGLAKREEWVLPLMVTAAEDMDGEIRGAFDLIKGQRAKVKALQGLLAENRVAWLNLGVCGRLLVAGDVAQVLGPEDGRLSDIDKVKGPDGRIAIYAEALQAREDAMVRTILESGNAVAIALLGGAHDLTGSVRRLGQES